MKSLNEYLYGADGIMQHYSNQNYARALELVETEGSHYPEIDRLLAHLRAAHRCRCGNLGGDERHYPGAGCHRYRGVGTSHV